MLKKVIAIVFVFCLIFSVNMMTLSAVNEVAPNKQQSMGERPDKGQMPPDDFTPMEGEFTKPQNEGEFMPPERNTDTEVSASKPDTGVTEENQKPSENTEESTDTQNKNSPFGDKMPEGADRFPGNMQNGQNAVKEEPLGFSGFVKTYSTPITSVILLALAFVFVVFYRRKNY